MIGQVKLNLSTAKVAQLVRANTGKCGPRRDYCLSKVQVAADYSDSVPDSPKYMGNQGYHPLEELKESKESKKKD
ncbi:hypothetical protein CK203_032466 [Vitis vinifera]|uniref:Uncharacterized protein n=1 Tax=Vitis vinifera TaxID=29760 RepID=A0A438I6H0_VITVI|nr:hypothetical protein CK203_032466 [Vitis vinifera]